MTKRIWAGLLALGMALTALPFGIYAEETAWEEEANASEETLDGGWMNRQKNLQTACRTTSPNRRRMWWTTRQTTNLPMSFQSRKKA